MGELKSFFEPKTIAVVGATNNPMKVGGILMNKLRKFKGIVIPINPKRKKVLNKKSFKTITEYDGRVDLVIIAIPSVFVAGILKECGIKGIKNVVVISSGFSEVGKFKLEDEIKDIVDKYGINLLGPNCFGMFNPWLNLDTTFANKTPEKGDVAFISQSGALWSYVSDFPEFKFSGFVSLGNMAGLNFSDFIEYFDRDKKTKSIVLYIEMLKKGREFIDACNRSGKDIVVVKAGKSKEGLKATVSHTGSLATDFNVYRGAFKQANVKITEDIVSALNYSKMKIKPKGKRVFIVTNAGGAGTLAVDYCVRKGLHPKPPVDLLGTARSKDYEKMLNWIKGKSFYDSVLVILTPQKMSEPEKTCEAICRFAKSKSVIACFLGEKSMGSVKKKFSENGVLCFDNLRDAIDVLGV